MSLPCVIYKPVLHKDQQQQLNASLTQERRIMPTWHGAHLLSPLITMLLHLQCNGLCPDTFDVPLSPPHMPIETWTQSTPSYWNYFMLCIAPFLRHPFPRHPFSLVWQHIAGFVRRLSVFPLRFYSGSVDHS